MPRKKDPNSATQLALAAGVHKRSADKFLRGQKLRGDAAEKLNRLMRRRGVLDLRRSAPEGEVTT
jgi:hypothetical protein